MDHWRSCSKTGKNSTYLLLKTTVLRPPGNLLELQNHWSYLRPTISESEKKIPGWLACTLGLGSILLFSFFPPAMRDLSSLSGVKPPPLYGRRSVLTTVSLRKSLHCSLLRWILTQGMWHFPEATCNRPPTQVGWCLDKFLTSLDSNPSKLSASVHLCTTLQHWFSIRVIFWFGSWTLCGHSTWLFVLMGIERPVAYSRCRKSWFLFQLLSVVDVTSLCFFTLGFYHL